jgi:dipeptidyl aminopeptidase/acylaminoacyl peptidase
MEEAGGLQDHIAGMRQLASGRPYMDLSRVGIYGHSGGGFASTHAILAYPEFYKVAVSSAGNHDQRSYLASWGEQYQGLLEGENYKNQANAGLAANLRGKLLLVHGDMDDNVHPAMTLQVVDALIKANKDFDLLIMPNRNHSFSLDPYFVRRKWDFFVRHLLGVEPPRL